jgi:hypothetical protein
MCDGCGVAAALGDPSNGPTVPQGRLNGVGHETTLGQARSGVAPRGNSGRLLFEYTHPRISDQTLQAIAIRVCMRGRGTLRFRGTCLVLLGLQLGT